MCTFVGSCCWLPTWLQIAGTPLMVMGQQLLFVWSPAALWGLWGGCWFPMLLRVVAAVSPHARCCRQWLLALLVHAMVSSGCWLCLCALTCVLTAGSQCYCGWWLLTPCSILGGSCSCKWSLCLGLKCLAGSWGVFSRTHRSSYLGRLKSGCLWFTAEAAVP